ncbi:efflux RND transporter periplasmic adaptor subunit [Helicobacter cholecystus]|uniref:Efflux RND transporter periplasmic adaptor subunit n=1 Tax=Helicobacter cholecystus TaxID=45498 RepID=A0A3D8IYF8_9HELI|nr:efflux RND transporter periplasmic adaptor subunit [Helicobacter cholecystus]RDU69591.1 efflux RND transporter periplasmic adaptor subunit [Helicobacter cholecystus]VEJ24149.1 RND family efflux transporter MFP subunit [Helicobacter cholecystus]
MEDIASVIKPKKKFYKILSYFLIILIGCGSGVYYYFQPKESRIVYDTVEPQKGDISTIISATGTLNPLNEVQIGSQVSGIISQIYVDTNDLVKRGQVLAKIDDQKILQELSRFEAQLKSAKAQLASLQATLKDKKWQYERLQKLYKQSKGKYPSFADVQTAQVAYEIAQSDIESKKGNIAEIEANINGVKIDLNNTIITSPIDGVVLTRSIDVGQTVAASFSAPELFRVAQNLEEMKLVVQIAESDVGKISPDQSLSFNVDAYPHHKFFAKVDKINYGSTTTDNIVSYEVTINVANKDLLLRPGMSATADIVVANHKNVLLLPVSALYFSPKTLGHTQSKKSSFFFAPPMKSQKSLKPNSQKIDTGGEDEIWILQGDQPVSKKIKVGITDGKKVEVEGIDEVSRVIVGMREEQ